MSESARLGVARLVIIAAIMLLIGVQMHGAVGPEAEQYFEDSAEWCDSRDGELVNYMAIGPGGGLHCELPNGTSVSMHELLKEEL